MRTRAFFFLALLALLPLWDLADQATCSNGTTSLESPSTTR